MCYRVSCLPSSRAQSFGRLGRCPQVRKVHTFIFKLLFCTDKLLCSWLNTLNLTINADLHLKLKEKGIKDNPPLGDGWLHWVPQSLYNKYVNCFGHQIEVSKSSCLQHLFTYLLVLQPNTCDSQLKAANHTVPWSSTVFKTSGAGGVLCGCCSLVWKNGIGDLQKGERLCLLI